MSKVVNFLVLPKEISAFEQSYLRRLNKIGLAFLALHVPVFVIIAWANGTGPLLAAVLTIAAVAGPALAFVGLKNPRTVSIVHGIAAMTMGGVLAHIGQGPVQIEMHFYFFAVLAMLAVFANPMVIVVAAVTVALHHAVVWAALPRSVFNYEAPIWVVGIHASFVVVESIATSFIARSFFDNVIGLEKIVTARTAELDQRNADMRLVLDNVAQGFVTIDRTGKLASEHSRVVDTWFGIPATNATIFDLFEQRASSFAERSRLGWDEVVEGIMPLDLTLDQMPRDLVHDGVHLQVAYQPIGSAESPETFLVVIADVSQAVARERAEREQREAMRMLERLLADRTGFQDFFEEASSLVSVVATGSADDDLVTLKRALHTLKGNSAIFGLQSVADTCHELETWVIEEGMPPPQAQTAKLTDRWQRLSLEIETLLGMHRRIIEIEESEHAGLELAVRRRAPSLVRMVHDLKLEPTQRRLDALATQAKRIASALEKHDVRVTTESNGLRLDAKHWAPFWSAFIHAIRNAVDHGLETPEGRSESGKSEGGDIVLRTKIEAGRLIVEVQDDGKGVDWERIAQIAVERGLPAATSEDLRMALFADGLSTAREVSAISGRGVGMGALLEAVQNLEGAIDVTSARGRGTTLRMSFPVAKMAPEFVTPVGLSQPPVAA